MALIKCPKCGQVVSDKLVECASCGYVFARSLAEGYVRIIVSPLDERVKSNQKVTLSENGRVVWEGETRQIAEVYFEKPTSIHIKYHTSPSLFGAECDGIINPLEGTDYTIQPEKKIFRFNLSLRKVN